MNSNKFKNKYGPWALVTGASSGMGVEFARQIADQGLNLVLVARRKERLESLAAEINEKSPVDIKIIAADLTSKEGIDRVKSETGSLQIGLLVNNAGREDSGYFIDTPLEELEKTMDLNCRAPLLLTHHFAREMVANKKGGIINLTSIVAFQGVPLISNYAATKAYDLIFSESLSSELNPHGIDVLAVAPGFTDTELSPDFDFSGTPINPLKPYFVANKAIHSLGKKRVVIPGFMNGFLYIAGKYLQPRILNTFSFGMVFKRVLRGKLTGSGTHSINITMRGKGDLL